MTEVSNNPSVRAQYNTLMEALDRTKDSRSTGKSEGHIYVVLLESGLAGTTLSKEKAASTTDIFKNTIKLMHSPELTATEKLNLKNRATNLLKEKEESLSSANIFKQTLFLLKGSSIKKEKQIVKQQLRELEHVSINWMPEYVEIEKSSITLANQATDPNVDYSQNVTETGEVTVSTSSDKTIAFIHDSTSPKSYYLHYYEAEKGLNMDRMGYGQSADGTNYAVLFDGATSGGKPNLVAAQHFTETSIQYLGKNLHQVNNGSLADESQNVFTAAANKAPEGAREGRATGTFATFVKGPDNSLKVRGAVLGDAAAIHISFNEGKLEAEKLNTVKKEGGRSDSGGDIGISKNGELTQKGNVSSFSKQVSEEDFVILASDGLIDNIYKGDVANILPIIISSPRFDHPLTPPTEWKEEITHSNGSKVTIWTLPDEKQLTEFAGEEKDIPQDSAQIAKRLNNYLKFVTASKTEEENQLYQIMYDTKVEKRAPNEQENQIFHEGDRARKQYKVREEEGTVPKTDDIGILVMTPTNKIAAK